MPPHAALWDGPPLSTTSEHAAARYQAGIAALVAGSGHAGRLLEAALAADPAFVLAAVGLAVSRVVDGGAYCRVVAPAGSASRGERQHVEVVNATLGGDADACPRPAPRAPRGIPRGPPRRVAPGRRRAPRSMMAQMYCRRSRWWKHSQPGRIGSQNVISR